MAAELHIAIKPETLFQLGDIAISNTLFTSILVSIATILFAVWANRQLTSVDRPSRAQSFVELIVETVYGIVAGVAGNKAWTFMPLIFGFLTFILLNNWAEQIPGFHTIVYTGQPGIHLTQVPAWMQTSQVFAHEGHEHVVEETNVALDTEHAAAAESSEVGHDADLVEVTDEHSTEGEAAHLEESHDASGTEHAAEGHKGVALLRGANADVNMTLALALISVAATQYFGFSFGSVGYLKKFFNFSSPIGFFVGLLELVGEFSRIISFTFRLFGNIFAGEVLIMVISFLVPVLLPTPFMLFELFVGVLQAYVFAMITAVTFTMAAEGHHDH